MAILSWIILGGLAGWLASMVAGKDASMGVLANVVVGIVGAFLGGWLWQLFGGSEEANLSDWDLSSFLIAAGGAVVLLMVLKLFNR